jgi:hypothetical protein
VAVSLVLWDQEREAETLQKRLGISQPLVEVFSNDPRLGDLAAWNPAAETVPVAEAVELATASNGLSPSPVGPTVVARHRRPGGSRRRRRLL